MARIARQDMYSEFSHIMIQGINKEYIFKNEKEINTYLKYLKEKLKDKDLEIIAYCIMNNHAHFLIYAKETLEISKLMSQVNTKYAMFYNKLNNRCGVVFRNRYRAEQILTYSHLISCINYIHNNPVKAKMCNSKSDYKYSSYNDYIKDSKIINLKNVLKVLKNYNIKKEDILKENYKSYKFIDDIEYENKEQLKDAILKNFMEKNHINNKEEIKNKEDYIMQLATIMYIDYDFTQKEIAELLEVNRLKINRILNKK